MRFRANISESSGKILQRLSILYVRFRCSLKMSTPIPVTFQFSMWDSGEAAQWPAKAGLLSILYVRFFGDAPGLLIHASYFQFSMWDSLRRLRRHPDRCGWLSILYVRFFSWRKNDPPREITFNSLCEIHDAEFLKQFPPQLYFQFSMWDSWAPSTGMRRMCRSLSILYVRFRAVFVIMNGLNIILLSILYVRFLHR